MAAMDRVLYDRVSAETASKAGPRLRVASESGPAKKRRRFDVNPLRRIMNGD